MEKAIPSALVNDHTHKMSTELTFTHTDQPQLNCNLLLQIRRNRETKGSAPGDKEPKLPNAVHLLMESLIRTRTRFELSKFAIKAAKAYDRISDLHIPIFFLAHTMTLPQCIQAAWPVYHFTNIQASIKMIAALLC